MTPFEQCLSSLLDIAESNDPNGLESVDRCVQIYLASPDSPRGIAHPCDDLAESIMTIAPDTELKNHILDKLFHVHRTSDA